MRRDLIIGILISVFLHGGFLFSDYLFKSHPKPPPPSEAPATIEAFIVPPIEPDKPDEPQEQEDTQPNVLAPPTLNDVPTEAPVDAFTQPIPPPPPEGLQHSVQSMTIPPTRPNASLIGQIFSVKDLDQQPAATFQPDPVYPEEMKRLAIPGEVLLRLTVNTKGEVVDAYVLKSSNPAFNENAIAGIKKWRFRTGKRGGKPVNYLCNQSITFVPKN